MDWNNIERLSWRWRAFADFTGASRLPQLICSTTCFLWSHISELRRSSLAMLCPKSTTLGDMSAGHSDDRCIALAGAARTMLYRELGGSPRFRKTRDVRLLAPCRCRDVWAEKDRLTLKINGMLSLMKTQLHRRTCERMTFTEYLPWPSRNATVLQVRYNRAIASYRRPF